MENTVALHPEFVKTLAEEMVKQLSGDERKDFYTKALETIDPEKIVKRILHDVKGVRRHSDLHNPATRRYIDSVAKEMKTLTVNELAEVFKQFVTI